MMGYVTHWLLYVLMIYWIREIQSSFWVCEEINVSHTFVIFPRVMHWVRDIEMNTWNLDEFVTFNRAFEFVIFSRTRIFWLRVIVSKINHSNCFCAQVSSMGWLRLVGSLKVQVSFAEHRLFYRAVLLKRPIILRSLLIDATTYIKWI